MNEIRIRSLSVAGLVTGLLLSVSHQVDAQDTIDNSNSNRYWAHAGFGGSSSGLAVGMGFSYRVGISLLSIRFVHGEEIQILGPTPLQYEQDFGVLYGVSARTSSVFASVSAGIGVASGVRRGKFISWSTSFSGEYERQSFSTIGLPIETQFHWILDSYFGIGITGFANLNREHSFGGGLISVQYGVLQ